MKTLEGHLSAEGVRFGIVISRFNAFITDKLLEGALDALRRHGASDENIEIIRVPGAFELAVTARRAAESGRYQAVICLGAIIRGDTPHFDYVAAETAKGIAMVGMSGAIPVAFGVLTTDTSEQAIERAGTKAGNKGWDAALSAMEMTDLFRKMAS